MTAITGSNPQSSESRRPIPQPHRKELLADSVERLVAVLFFALSFGVVVYCLTLYHTNWMHPEVFLAERKHIVGLTSLHWQDIARFFDCEALSDQCTRSRSKLSAHRWEPVAASINCALTHCCPTAD